MDLSAYKGKSRILVVFSKPDDPRVAEQDHLIMGAAEGVAERDLLLVKASTGDAECEKLRSRLGAPKGDFVVALVGKDGGLKWTATKPATASQLFATIDQMPMRRQERK